MPLIANQPKAKLQASYNFLVLVKFTLAFIKFSKMLDIYL